MPDDLLERGRQYDAQRLGGVAVELKSPCHRAPGPHHRRHLARPAADRRRQGLGDPGFGSEAKQAMQQRADSWPNRVWPSGAGSA